MPPKRPAVRGGRSAAASSASTPSAAPSAQPSTASNPGSSEVVETNAAPVANGTQPVAAARGRGGRPAARPRGIARRSQVDRLENERVEAEKRQAEAAVQAREQAYRQRSEQARGRGSTRARLRGGYAGETERRKDSSQPVSGPFSLGEVNKYKSARSGASGGGSRVFAGSSGRSGGTSGPSEHVPVVSDIHVKHEDGGYISSDLEDDDPKLDIDNLIDLTVEDDEDDRALPPVRISRVEHKERNLVGGTDSGKTTGNDDTIATGTDKRRKNVKAVDVEITRESQRYKGTYTDSESEDDAVIKAEPPLDDDPAISQNPIESPPTSPEARRKAKERIKAGALLGDSEKPSFQTKEEELEYDIYERDRRILRTELGPSTLPPAAQLETLPDATEDPRTDKVYLFQFPAILPGLASVIPKAENEDVNMLDIPEANPSGSAKDKIVKKPVIDNKATVLGAGRVGKLRVHASGKAYLDWGGIPMEVRMGQESHFLQDIVVLDEGDSRPAQSDEEPSGTAVSMGQVKGKFVVVPEWDKIFEHAI